VSLRILVTGASGLLGQKVAEFAQVNGHEVYAIYREHTITMGTPIKLDLTDNERLLRVISKLKPDAIIHTAAYSDVEGCETNRNLAWKINAEATKHLATAAVSAHSHLTYVSTDYVFDGMKGLYTEQDVPNPISHYGYTKLKGEEFIKEHASKWCIARPSVIYGWGPKHKLNFATWLINSLGQRREVRILTDQHISPTLNTNLAKMLIEIAEREITGILHTAGATRVNRYEFALKLADFFCLEKSLVKPAKTDEMQWKAKRPKDSSLNVSKATALLNQKPLKLDRALVAMKKENTSNPSFHPFN